MRIKEVKLYQYSELSDRAKRRARDWYREESAGDTYFAETTTEEFEELLKACGFDITTTRHTGRPHNTITWSGFSSQGDGAAFSGSWNAARCKPQKILDDRPATYTDSDGKTQTCAHNAAWHKAVAPLVAFAAKYPDAYGSIENRGTGFYMSLESFDPGEDDAGEDAEGETLLECARGLAHTFYRALEKEYEYQYSDEVVAATIEANEYEFTEDGNTP